MWQNLIDIIQTLVEVYAQLFVLNEKKRKAILDIDMHTLENIVNEEQEMVNKIATIESTRQTLLKKMAHKNAFINPLSNSKTIAMFCPQEYKEQFLVANKKLSDAVKKTSAINGTNRLLMQGALTAVNMNINSLTQMKAEPNYKKNGSQNFSPQNKNLDFKV